MEFRVFVEPATAKPTVAAKDSALRCWKATNFDGMSRYLSAVDWDHIFTVNFTADTIWSAFCDILNDAIEQFVSVNSTRQTRKLKLKHYPNSIKKTLSRKKCLWRKLRSNPDSDITRASYKLAAAKSRTLIRNYEIKQEQQVIRANNTGDLQIC